VNTEHFLKRILDIVVSMLGLILLLPWLVVIAILVYVLIDKSVFFRQLRPGLYAKPFEIIKFRTMQDKFDASGSLQSDAERLTRFGQFLRATSLDELPELWNVLKGEMSLVGPRPLLMEYLTLYSSEQARRHQMKPGITGWAQVSGRNALTWEKKFKLDVWYVDNVSLLLDFKILLLTVLKVAQREGISSAGEATMSKFTGKQE
jgi:lipopolysaccharide/colanic/teichoic acid biosynthesis glycosyltransferase